MTLQIYRLRRLLAATAILLTVVVAGMYFYARFRAISVLSRIPGKMGIEIKQTVNGFQLSKSDGKRTLFTIQASDVKQFKLDGRAELHNVSIVLYGRDSSRFDQIYGDDFAYDPKTGDVTAKGDVQIDLVANPAGLASPDQSTPKELKNPIHLKTRDLVFNRETGNATTDAQVEFRTPQAAGTAVGVKYVGKSNTLTLGSQIHVVLDGHEGRGHRRGSTASSPTNRGKSCSTIRTLSVTAEQRRRTRPCFTLAPTISVERVLATGNVRTRDADTGRKGQATSRVATPRCACDTGNAGPRRSGGVSADGIAGPATPRDPDRQRPLRANRTSADAGRRWPRDHGIRRPEPAAESSRRRRSAPVAKGCRRQQASGERSGKWPAGFRTHRAGHRFHRRAGTHSAARRNLGRGADHDRPGAGWPTHSLPGTTNRSHGGKVHGRVRDLPRKESPRHSSRRT